MAMPTYSISRSLMIERTGMSPFTTSLKSGRARIISNRKQSPTVAMSVMTSASRMPNAAVLKHQEQQDVEPGDEDAHGERDVEQQIERDRRSDDFGQIAGGDGDLAEHPQRDRHGTWIVIAACLREISAGDDSELGRQPLEQYRHEVGEQDDAEQRIPEP
jgi:hypothetical protein